jgi:hypothetical protein
MRTTGFRRSVREVVTEITCPAWGTYADRVSRDPAITEASRPPQACDRAAPDVKAKARRGRATRGALTSASTERELTAAGGP